MHTIGYTCRSTHSHTHILISTIDSNSYKNLWCFRWMHFNLQFMQFHFQLIFLKSTAPLRDSNNCLHFYCIIMPIRRCFKSPLAPGNVRGTQQGSCEALQRADWSLFARVHILHFSEKCVLFSSESGYLSCSFDDGLCGWIRDKDGDLHWETTPDLSGNWRAGVHFSQSHTLIRTIVYFIVSKWEWKWE